MLFEGLKINVKNMLRKPPPPEDPPNGSELFDVVIQHNDADSQEAALIREHLRTRHRLRAQFANPTIPKRNRLRSNKRNQEQYYQRAKRFVVLYGQTDDEWTNDMCFAMQPYIQRQHAALVLLVPPQQPPQGKQFYLAPDEFRFSTKPCFDRKYAAVLDEWLQNASAGDTAQNG